MYNVISIVFIMFQMFDCDAIMKTPNESTIEATGEAKDAQTGDTIEAIKTVFSCRMEQGDNVSTK